NTRFFCVLSKLYEMPAKLPKPLHSASGRLRCGTILPYSFIGQAFFRRTRTRHPPGSSPRGRIMTDIGRKAHIAPAQTQLSVSSYFDDAIFVQEQELIFKKSSLYIGHEKLVPEIGDWRTLPQEDSGRVLVRNSQGVELISNVCRHRQAIMLGGIPQNGCTSQTQS